MKRGKTNAKRRPLAVVVEPVVGRSRFIISADAGINPAQAFYFCLEVAKGGRISGGEGRKQHCYATRFGDGTVVYVRRNKSGSEQFTVQNPPNPRGQGLRSNTLDHVVRP